MWPLWLRRTVQEGVSKLTEIQLIDTSVRAIFAVDDWSVDACLYVGVGTFYPRRRRLGLGDIHNRGVIRVNMLILQN